MRFYYRLFIGALCWMALVTVPGTVRAQVSADSAEAEKTDKDAPLPLAPGRFISFSTDEGSWLSLDVSPDGETIVFELLGDLYTLPIGGGQAQPLTSGMAFDSQPRFSPDGRLVVFVSDRSGSENLWTLEVGGQDTTQVTKGKNARYRSPEWTPDGRYVVASKAEHLGPAKLWLYHVEGGSGAALIKEPENQQALGAAFGPDGRYLWFARRTGGWQYNAQLPQYQLAVYDRETGQTYGRSARFGSAFRPTLSPDGRWLVYGTRHDRHTGLRLRDLETGAERWLAYPIQRDDQESRATRDVLPGMAFTPDSRHVVTSYGGKIWKLAVEEGRGAQAVPFTVDVALGLGPEVAFDYPVSDAPVFVVQQIRDAVPSPDGGRLAFTALNQLYVMDLPGGTPRRLAELEALHEHQPTWSPDGQWIAFATWSTEGGALYKVPAGGGRPVRLTTTPAYYRSLAWSPDGDRLVAVRSAAEAFTEETGGTGNDLVWISAEGGAPTLIVPFEGLSDPHFTRDADRIYAYSGSDGLVSMRWDGTDRKAHVKVKGAQLPGSDEPLNASTILMAPEGDQALAQVVNDLYLVTVPYVGGETPTVSVANPDAAAFPARRLTETGGQFPAWGRDGRAVHWSIGNAHFVYDLDAAEAFADSLEAVEAAEDEDEDAAAGDEEGEGSEEETPRYRPREYRVRIEARRDLPEGVAVLRGARAITMRGDEVIEEADVVVRDNRIVAVGPRGQVQVPRGAEVIDLSGKTILPGFVDAHAHLRPPFGIHKTQVWEYLANLAYGVTTTRDPQTGTTDVLTYADLVRTGALLGPRIYSTGPGVFWTEQVRDQEHADNVLKRYSDYFDTKTIKMYLSGNRQQRQWIIKAARDHRIMPTTEGGLDLKLNLTQIIDGYPGHEHNFPITPLYRDVVELTARANVLYTPTLLVTYGGPFAENYFYTTEDVHSNAKLRRFTPHHEIDQRVMQRTWFHEERWTLEDHARFVADLVAAGGRAAVGSHGQLQGLGYHWELWTMQAGGLSAHDALRCATIFGAEGLGLDGDLGSIAPGKLADLVVLARNPLDDIRNTDTITHVMKGGRLYEGDTLREVYPRRRDLPALWWQGREPVQTPGLFDLGG